MKSPVFQLIYLAFRPKTLDFDRNSRYFESETLNEMLGFSQVEVEMLTIRAKYFVFYRSEIQGFWWILCISLSKGSKKRRWYFIILPFFALTTANHLKLTLLNFSMGKLTKKASTSGKKVWQKIIAKTNKCNIKEDEALVEILKRTNIYVTFFFSSLKRSPKPLFLRLSFFSHFCHSLYWNINKSRETHSPSKFSSLWSLTSF